MTEEYQAKTLKPTTSAPVRFKGRIIAETEWDTRDGCWMRFTVWETRGGAYIAQISGDVPGKPDQVHCSVGVVEPIFRSTTRAECVDVVERRLASDEPHKIPMEATVRDETAMQIAVLQHFDWHDRAKAMLKRELGWAPVIEVA